MKKDNHPKRLESVRRILVNFGRGVYSGFMEWHGIPDSETGIAKLGFVVGFVVKVLIILFVGAEYLPV